MCACVHTAVEPARLPLVLLHSRVQHSSVQSGARTSFGSLASDNYGAVISEHVKHACRRRKLRADLHQRPMSVHGLPSVAQLQLHAHAAACTQGCEQHGCDAPAGRRVA